MKLKKIIYGAVVATFVLISASAHANYYGDGYYHDDNYYYDDTYTEPNNGVYIGVGGVGVGIGTTNRYYYGSDSYRGGAGFHRR